MIKKLKSFFTGSLLLAMPSMTDKRFKRALVYVCGHDSQGAIGIVINKLVPSFTFENLLKQINIEPLKNTPDYPIYFGGPVEMGRGFVLHSDDYKSNSTIIIQDGVALTATTDVLRALAHEHGPEKLLLALGYAGWSPGQLEQEIAQNHWLHVPGDPKIIFDCPLDERYNQAFSLLGGNSFNISIEAGHA